MATKTKADGFKSPRDRRVFIREAAVAGLVCCALLSGSFAFLFAHLGAQTPSASSGDSDGGFDAALAGENLWYLSKGAKAGDASLYALVQRPPDSPAVRRAVFPLASPPFLLNDTRNLDRVWLFSADQCAYQDSGGLHWLDATGSVEGVHQRPFFVGKWPAMMSCVGGSASIWILKPWHWEKAANVRFTFPPASGVESAEKEDASLRVAWNSGGFEWYFQGKDGISHARGIPRGRGRDIARWDSLLPNAGAGAWAVVDLPQGRLLAVALRDAARGSVGVWQEGKSGLKKLLEFPGDYGSVGLLGQGPRAFTLVLQNPGLSVVPVTGLTPGPRETLLTPPLPRAALPGPMLLALSLLLLVPVFLLASLQHSLDRHRPTQGLLAGKKVVYASLGRRALARAADALFAVIPFSAILLLSSLVVVPYARHAADPFHSRILSLVSAVMASAFLALVGTTLLLVAWEGKTGRTPGRKLFHVRLLGADLKPCGFKRALARALLSAVDGFWFWTVGLYSIAFSPRYQRLGDRVVDTVVLREK